MVLLDELASARTLHQCSELVFILGRGQNHYGLADHLIGSVTVDSLRASIPCSYRQVQRSADNGVIRRCNDVRQTAQLILEALALADIHDSTKHARPLGCLDWI